MNVSPLGALVAFGSELMSLTGMFDAGGLKSVSLGPEMQGSRSLERTERDKRTAWLGVGLDGSCAGGIRIRALVAVGVFMKLLALWPCGQVDDLMRCESAPAEMMNVACSVPTPECV